MLNYLISVNSRIALDGTKSASLFYLVGHRRKTFAIELEPHRLDGQFLYKVDQSFDVQARLLPLSELEGRLPPQAEVTTLSFEIDSWACASGGAIIKPTRYGTITDPLPKRRQPNSDDDDDGIGDDAHDVQGDDDHQLVVGTELLFGLIIITSCCCDILLILGVPLINLASTLK